MNNIVRKICSVILVGASSLVIACNGNVFEKMINGKDTISPTVALTYDQAGNSAGPFMSGTLTITATYSEELAAAPLISIDQQGAADISVAAMTDEGDGEYTYTYTVQADDGSAYLDGQANVTLSDTTDIAGNASGAPSNNTFIIDTKSPTVYITYDKAGDSTSPYNAGDVTITANYSEVLASAPTIDIENPGFNDESGTMTAVGDGVYTYTYTINAANVLLGYEDGTATVTISDATDPAGNAGGLPSNNTFVIDTTSPKPVIDSVTNSPTNGAFVVNIDFGENVSGFTSGEINVTNGSVTSFSGSGQNYTATITPTPLFNGNVTVSINSGVAVDDAGNSSEASDDFNMEIDLSALTTTLQTTTGSYSNSSTFTVNIVFSKVVDDFVQGDITVTNGSVTGFSGSGDTYSATITHNGQGLTTVQVGAGTAHDSASNPNVVSNTINVTYDTVQPTVEITYNKSGDATSPFNAGNVTITATYLEVLESAPVISIYQQGTTDISGATMTSAGVNVYTYTYTIHSTTEGGYDDGTATVSLSPTTDRAGNASAAPTNNTFVIDTTAPVLSITAPSGSARVNASTMITFSDNETTNPQVSADGTNWTNAVSGTTTLGSIAQFAGLTEGGSFTLYLRDTDAAGNTNSTNISLTKDTAAPTVEISYDKGGDTSSPFNTGDVTITAEYSEALASAPAISINQQGSADISGITMTYVSPGVYRYTYTVHAADGSSYMDGTATISLSATTDTAGNTSAAPTNNTFVIDTTAPVVAITAPSDNSSVNDSAIITFTDDGTSPQFSVNGTTWTTAVSGSTISQFTGLAQGAFTLYLRDIDAAGNTGSTSINLTRDISAPTVSITAGTSPTNANPQFTINFNEEMTGFASGDITINSTNGSVTSLTTSDNRVFTATVTPSVSSGTVIISIGAAVATDLAGNSNTASTTASVVYDGSLPTITEALTLDTDGDGKIDHYRITFSEGVDESTFIASEWSVSGYTGVAHDSGYAGNTAIDTVVYIVFNEIPTGYDTGVEPDLTSIASVSLEDLNSNKIAEVQSTAVTETDGANPIIITASGITGTTGISITFSEEVKAQSGSISEDDFDYTDVSGDGASYIDSMADIDGLDRIVSGALDVNLAITDLNVDTLSASAAGIAKIVDYADTANYLADSTVPVTGAVAPYVLSAFATADTKIRLYYSEAMNLADATDEGNYSLTYTSGSVTITGITQIDGSIYEITTGSNLASATTYTLTITGTVHDLDGVALVNPKFASFLGNEQLTIGAATCITTKSLLVVFNKPVLSGTGANGAERTANYKLAGPNELGASGTPYTPDTAVRGTISYNEVTLTHTNDQSGVGYMVIGANNDATDGFSDAGYDIQADGVSEYLQDAPGDRVSWNGCGADITDFTSPIALDPFGDASDFGYLVSYGGMVYIGPNQDGNSATRMEANGKNPVNVSYTFTKDSSASNIATGIVSIGHSGCTPGSNDPSTGCGPDNENGRGIFVTGEVNGTTHLFITGARPLNPAGDNDYIYWTADTDSVLDFNYIDGSGPLDALNVGGNKNTESIFISGGNVYWMQPGDLRYRPYFTRMTLPGTVSDINIADSTSATSGNGTFMSMRTVEGMGVYATTKKNSADVIGGTVYAFNSYIYVANNGSVRSNTGSYTSLITGRTSANGYRNDGGIVRSKSTVPGNSGSTTDWSDITPSTNADFSYYFSIPLGAMGDVIPAQRPIPAFATFNNRLYMIRNACVSNMVNGSCVCNDSHTGACDDDITCPSGSEVPQLWKCDPGVDNLCDASEWTLVPTGTTDLTNFSDTDNTSITLLVTNGSYLYIGFDNAADGVKLYRTNVVNPTSTADFEQVGANGLGRTDMKEIYSAISVLQGADYYIYVSAGFGGEPVAVYRQKNN